MENNMQYRPSRIIHNKNKSSLLKTIGAILLLAAIAGAVIYFAPKMKSKNAQNGTLAAITGENLAAQIKKDAQKFCADFKAADMPACLQEFYLNKSREASDESVCNLIENGEQKTVCLDQVYAGKAFTEKNVSICNKISKDELKKSCADMYYEQISQADSSKGEELCVKISDQSQEERCLNAAYYDLAFRASQKDDMAQAEGYCAKIKNDDQLMKICGANIKIKR